MTDAARLRPTTSKEVAQLAGVSRSTVSNILNGNGSRFSEETKRRVRTAAAQLRYTPSQAGRALVSGRSSTVVLVLPSTAVAPSLQEAIDKVVTEFDAVGGNVVVRFAGATPKATVSALIGMAPLAVLDLGVLGSDGSRLLEERGILVAPSAEIMERASATDNGIARIQADALLAAGPRALWFARYPDDLRDPYSASRLTALQEYAEAKGLPLPRSIRVPSDLQGAVDALRAIIENSVGAAPGVICYNDDVALCLLAAARELGLRVPADVSLIGVDHTPMGQLWSPRLTTIDTDVQWFVDMLANDLRARLRGETTLSLESSPEGHFALVPGETC